MVRKTKPTREDMLKSSQNVQFHCYDTIMEHIPYHDRALFLITNLKQSYCVKFLPPVRVDCEERAKLHHQENLGAGYEGSILRTNDVYKCGRSWSLRKFKDFHDTEATIVGFVEGKGKRKGTIGKFIAEDKDGIMFGMPVMDKFKYLQDNFEEMKTWIGKTATFTYFERTKANSYRHPLFKCIRNYE